MFSSSLSLFLSLSTHPHLSPSIPLKSIFKKWMRSLSLKKAGFSCCTCLLMVSIGILIKFTNGRSKIGRVSYCKLRFTKNRANTNKMNFPTINETIVVKENSAAPEDGSRPNKHHGCGKDREIQMAVTLGWLTVQHICPKQAKTNLRL